MRKYPVILALLLALLPPPVVWAADDTADESRLRQELAQARRELAELSRRVAELSQQLGEQTVVKIQRSSHRRPMVGLVLGASETRGVRVQAVTPDGPAARAGLRSGDIITHIDGSALDAREAEQRIADAQRALADLGEGQEVRLRYEREGRPADVTVTAEPMSPFAFAGLSGVAEGLRALERLRELELPDGTGIDLHVEKLREDLDRRFGDIEERIHVIGPFIAESLRFDAWRWQGLRLAALDADLGRYFGTSEGVLVLKAEGEGLAGLQAGDVIERIDGEPVRSPREAMARLSRAEPGQPLALTILRDRRRSEVRLTAPDRPDVTRWLVPPAPPAPPGPPAAPEPPEAPPTPPAPPRPGGSAPVAT